MFHPRERILITYSPSRTTCEPGEREIRETRRRAKVKDAERIHRKFTDSDSADLDSVRFRFIVLFRCLYLQRRSAREADEGGAGGRFTGGRKRSVAATRGGGPGKSRSTPGPDPRGSAVAETPG